MKILFVKKHKGIVCKLIRYFTNSQFDHVAPIIGGFTGEHTTIEMCLSANNPIVTLLPAYQYLMNKEHYYCEVVESPTPIRMEHTVSALFLMNRKVYGFASFPWFLWRWLSSKLKRKVRSNNWMQHGYFCSEIGAIMLQLVGDMPRELEPDNFSPEDLYQYCMKQGWPMTARWGHK